MSDVPAISTDILKSICDMWSGSDSGLDSHEMGVILRDLGIVDVLPATSKSYRLYSALSQAQEATNSGERVVAFIEKVMSPVRYTANPEKFDERRTRINRALAFAGLRVEETGKVVSTDRTSTLLKVVEQHQPSPIVPSEKEAIAKKSVHVFISYSSEDQHLVIPLRDALTEGGVRVWLDREQIKPGMSNWQKAIRQAIDEVDFFVYIASETGKDSEYVLDEIGIAADKKKPVIPFWASGTVWRECIPLGFGSHQYIDARGPLYGVGLVKLLKALGIL